MSSKRLILVFASVGVVTGMVFVASTVFAKAPVVTYYACLKAGKLTKVGTTSPSCPKGATVISWNSTGPRGPAGPGAEMFATPGTTTYNVPAGVSWVEVVVQGAGGGGTGGGAGAGGGGATVTGLLPVTTSCDVQVGRGGAGNATDSPGGTGGTSVVTCNFAEAVAEGGSGGTVSGGGAGGTGGFGAPAVGITNLSGQVGGFVCPTPSGGNSGGGTGGGSPNSNGGTGGGGGGDCSGSAGGGNGGNGLVEIIPAISP